MGKALKNSIKENGVSFVADLVGGIDYLFDVLNIKTPEEYLNNFNDLTPVTSIERPRLILYRYVEGNNMLVYDTINSEVYVNSDTLWNILSYQFGLQFFDVRAAIKKWIKEIYGISNVEVFSTWAGKEDELL